MDLKQILAIADQIITILILVSGVLIFLCRTYIAAWIKNKFAAEIGKQLASHKYNLDRDLETYKNSLVRDLEQLKANIDLRRAIALQVASTKLAAFTRLFADLNDFLNTVLTYPAIPPQGRPQLRNELSEKTALARSAFRAAEIHIAIDLRGRIVRIISESFQYAHSFTGTANQANADDPTIRGFMAGAIEINALLRVEVDRLGL